MRTFIFSLMVSVVSADRQFPSSQTYSFSMPPSFSAQPEDEGTGGYFINIDDILY